MTLLRSLPLLALFSMTLMPFVHALDADELDLPPVTIVDTENLQHDGNIARQSNLPILIMFGMQGCAYCKLVEEEHLKPMLRNADYRSKVIIRRIQTDSYQDIVNFDGSNIPVSDIASRYNANFSPTVVFLDHEGNELAPRLIGVRVSDFYGYELDQGIELSLQKMRNQLAALSAP